MRLLHLVSLSYQLLCFGMLAASIVLAWQHGGREERATAAMFVAATIGSWAANLHSYAAPEHGLMLVDAMLFIGLAALALRSPHFWPLWAAGFQLVTVLVHVAKLGEGDTGLDGAWAYAIGLNFWSFPVLAAFLHGIWTQPRLSRARSAAAPSRPPPHR